MAIAGLLAFVCALGAVLIWLGWKKNSPAPVLLWEPRSFAASYTSVVGPLAAFSIASAIFMAGVSVNRQTQAFETMIGMLLVAYIIFTGTAMMFASTPGAISDSGENFRRLQRFSIAIAMLGYGVGVSIAWLTLSPLLKAIDLGGLSETFIWLLLVTTFGAAMRWSLFMYRLFEVRRRPALLMPPVAFLAAAAYHLAAREAAPQSWPGHGAPLVLTILLFAIVVLGFAGHSLLLNAYDPDRENPWLAAHGHRLAIVMYGVATGVLFLLWMSLAFPSGPAEAGLVG